MTSAQRPLTRIDTTNISTTHRMRRLRRTDGLRRMVRETRLAPTDFIYPVFVTVGHGVREPIPSMPGQSRLSVDQLAQEAAELRSLDIPAILLFGIPETKDAEGSGAWISDGIIQQATRALKDAQPELVVVTDVCLCEYTDHGHCGVLADDGSVLNDASVEVLATTALSQAEAGADVIAPSDMMDGRIGVIRQSARRGRLRRSHAAGLFRQVRLGLLRPVPRRGGLGAAVRRPARLSDGSAQRPRGNASHRAGSRRRRRHSHGQAGVGLSRPRARGARTV